METELLLKAAQFAERMEDIEVPGGGKLIAARFSETTQKDEERAAWLEVRLGKITCSNFHRVTRGRGDKGWSQTAETYLNELVWEWLTGLPAQDVSSRATDWGNEHEAEAIAAYEKQYRRKVERGRFVKAKGFSLVGGTPDGIGKSTGLEAKCPYGAANHVTVLLSEKEGIERVPDAYKPQVVGHMLVTGKKGCVFVSYDPRPTKKEWRMVVVEVERNEAEIQELRDRLTEFEGELIKRLDRLGVDWRERQK